MKKEKPLWKANILMFFYLYVEKLKLGRYYVCRQYLCYQ